MSTSAALTLAEDALASSDTRADLPAVRHKFERRAIGESEALRVSVERFARENLVERCVRLGVPGGLGESVSHDGSFLPVSRRERYPS
jgi:hypothetical protein